MANGKPNMHKRTRFAKLLTPKEVKDWIGPRCKEYDSGCVVCRFYSDLDYRRSRIAWIKNRIEELGGEIWRLRNEKFELHGIEQGMRTDFLEWMAEAERDKQSAESEREAQQDLFAGENAS